jgi:preprotein translocase subunit SecD
MSGAWWTRVVIIFFAICWGVWMLVPTYLAPSAQERAAAQAAAAQSASDGSIAEDGDVVEQEEEETFFASLLPSAQLSLGLDLQGGIDMTLQVEVDEAVVSSV